MAISKIKYPRIDFSGFINGDADNKLVEDSSGKLKVGLSAGTGVTLSSSGVIAAKINNTVTSQATDEAASANVAYEIYTYVNNQLGDINTALEAIIGS